MNRFLKVIIAALIVLILGVLLEKHVQPIVNAMGWSFLPLFNILIIPFWYYLVTLFGWGAQFNKFIRLLGLFGIGIVFVFLTELFVMDRIYGQLVAYLIGTLLTGLYLLIETYIVNRSSIKKRRED